MECMKQRSKSSKALAQLAVIVFCLNATYGICCFALPTADAMNTAGMEMPCHQTDGESGASSTSDDCCLMCMPMMASIDIRTSNASAEVTPAVRVSPAVTVGGIDPPFRPPTSRLS